MPYYNIYPSGPFTMSVGDTYQFTNKSKGGNWSIDNVVIAITDQEGFVTAISIGETNLKYWIGNSYKSCKIIVE